MADKDSYTILILPSPTENPYRFALSRRAVGYLLGFCSFAAVLLVVFLVHFFVMLGDMSELRSLRKETGRQREQIDFFAKNLEALKAQMARVRDFDLKLRQITDLGPPREVPASPPMGVGGDPQTQERDEKGGGADRTSRAGNNPELLLGLLGEEVTTLSDLAHRQERSLADLIQGIKNRKTIWASTPSIWPTEGWVSSGFGHRVSPFTGTIVMHRGLDIAADAGTMVIASADGIVTSVGVDTALGKMIRIDHGHGLATSYSHLSRIEVVVGQRVKRGGLIARVGNSGLSTGSHLHYEVYVGNTPVNPLGYIMN